MADIAVIVVNYAAADLAVAAVQSVLDRGHPGHRVRVHVVDNASPGDDAARLARAAAERGWGDRGDPARGGGQPRLRARQQPRARGAGARGAPRPTTRSCSTPTRSSRTRRVAILADFLEARIRGPPSRGPASASRAGRAR